MPWYLFLGGFMELVKKEPIIFIISGKANSGKDTSCDLINNYIKIKKKRIIKKIM